MLQAIKPRSKRTARALAKRDPLAKENPKVALFLEYTKSSSIVHLLFQDLRTLRRPYVKNFDKRNALHPFEDATSFEFFSDKNDAALLLFGSHSKKRPHAVTFVRCFEHKVLDMLELMVDPETMRSLSQFKNARKPAVGLKPLVCFSGSLFDSPTPNAYTLAKSVLLDFFKGPDATTVDVEGLQYMVWIGVGEETGTEVKPRIMVRCYMIRTRRSGQRLPKVEVEEMGPRIDFRIGRIKEADPAVMKEALKKPKGTEPKSKKNIETDLIGDKVGRIHLGKQDLSNLQTRKMKGLKRTRGEDADLPAGAVQEDDPVEFDGDVKEAKRPRV